MKSSFQKVTAKKIDELLNFSKETLITKQPYSVDIRYDLPKSFERNCQIFREVINGGRTS